MPERFAIYYSPPAGSVLWRRAAQWLGRDPGGDEVAPVAIGDIPIARRTALTQSARRYGFHATIKAPMALAQGRTRQEMEAALQSFALKERAVPIGKLVLKNLDGFLALVPEVQQTALTEFAARCVTAFEPFRAPMSEEERARRIAAGLSAYQIGLLDHYGYPYVMDQFQFHMTLTDRLPPDAAQPFITAAEAWFEDAIAKPFKLDRLALFHQAEAEAPFRRVADFPLSTKVLI